MAPLCGMKIDSPSKLSVSFFFQMSAPRMGSGRAVAHGEFYTREGNLIALTTQEGVVRANVRAPDDPKAKL